jgi:hypothetical protein
MFRVTVTTMTISPEGRSTPPLPLEPPPSIKKIEWAWKIVSRPPTMQFIELNRETFYEMLMEVSNG